MRGSSYRRRAKKPIKRFDPRMQATLMLVFCVVLIAFGVLFWRIYALSQSKTDGYKKKVLSQQTYMSNVIPYKRGDIKDRNQTTIATSVHVYDLLVDPKFLLEEREKKLKEARQKAAQGKGRQDGDTGEGAGLDVGMEAVRECFGAQAYAEVERVLAEKPTSRYVKVNGFLDMDVQTVEPFRMLLEGDTNIKGVWLEEKYARKYPMGTVGCHIIGFSNSENVGTWGMEESYNEQLNGINGREYGFINSELKLERTLKPAENGYTVISTIDANVQKIVERLMGEWQKEVGSENMGVILANPNNGEIYAMANEPLFDLNNPRDLTAFLPQDKIEKMSEEKKMEELSKIWRNYCISDAYEPGSTYKPFTIAAAIEEGLINADSSFVCDGAEVVAGRRIRCVNRSGHGTLSLSGVLEQSCNDAVMQISRALGRDAFFQYNGLFGFGTRSGVDLPGEATGILHKLENLNPVELATSSFGQTQSVTMVQMLAGFCSLVNGGYYYEPHVVKQVVNEQGAVIDERSSYLVKQTVSKSTSEYLKQALFNTVEVGTADMAKVAGYEICGKTGTAEKRPVEDKNYLLSFLGFAPLDDPQIVIYVTIDQPHVEDQAHSSIASLFASRVLKETLPFLEVYPNRKVKKEKQTQEPTQTQPSTQTQEPVQTQEPT